MFNILDGKAEVERIIYDDADAEVGFIMAPDLKWDQKELENLYVLAIARKRGILSLRDLREEHLPMLRNILEAGKVSTTLLQQSTLESLACTIQQDVYCNDPLPDSKWQQNSRFWASHCFLSNKLYSCHRIMGLLLWERTPE